jgi:DNA-binding NtrC family response regulator
MPWVLVVDDDAPVRVIVTQFLAEKNVEVVGVESAVAALQVLAERPTEPVVAFVDVLMPGMDGLTLTRKLRSRLKRTTLVIISGHLNDLSWWPVDLREVAFLPKPFRLSDINDYVTTALRDQGGNG